jgi:hypothetical protein
VESSVELIRRSTPNEFSDGVASPLMSNYGANPNVTFSKEDGLLPSSDSFIRGVIQAWGEHLHLVIRPEEVWFTILTQMNFYMNSHAEDIRELFVSHEGQQTIKVKGTSWDSIILMFQDAIQDRVKLEWLREWILPGFSTSTQDDAVISSILMMGITKAYFKFEGQLVCGLPSVTLLGKQEDWEALLGKLDRLPEFGKEPTEYAARLRPILSRFVHSFKEPRSNDTVTFWNQIVTAKMATGICGAPPFYLSGWIIGFYYWNLNGGPFARSNEGKISLDGQNYPSVAINDLPVGYAVVDLVMQNNGGPFSAAVAAGPLGKRIIRGYPYGYLEARKKVGLPDLNLAKEGQGTLQPLSSWFLYGPVADGIPRRRKGDGELSTLAGSIASNWNSGTCALRA